MTTQAEEDIGGLVRETRDLVEEYIKPASFDIVDPISGVSAPVIIDKDGVHGVPASIFDDYLPAPRFRRGTANLTALDSFIEHVNRFRTGETVVFACDNRAEPSLTAVLDYHPAGAASPPSFGRHRSQFKFPLSDEWKAWQEMNGEAMGMADFAAFLEDRIVDVEHPDDVTFSDEKAQDFITKLGGKKKIASPTKLLELSQGLSINENSVIQQTTKLQSGEAHVVFQSEHVDGNGIEVDIPSMFVLAIPVFRNGDFYRVIARLRYRATNGTLRFWYDLWRTDRVFDHSFGEAVEKVKAGANAPVLLGSPE